MKLAIRELHVERFGKLRDRRFAFDGAMTLVFGPNEAGKSTLLAFLRSMLFGLPSRSAAADRYAPEEGAYGGTVTLVDGQGRTFLIERKFGLAGRRGGSGVVRVCSPDDGDVGGEERLNALMGGISAELYRNFFAFSLDELQEIATLQSDDLSRHLYGAGWGAGGGAVLAAERRLSQEMDRLYRPRGKNQPLAQAIAAWEDAEAEWRRGREQMDRYREWAVELESLDRQIRDAETEAGRLRERTAWLDACIRARPHGYELADLDARLAELPDFPSFPEAALPRFERLAAERDRLIAEKLGRESRLAELKREDDQLNIDSQLLADKPRLEALLEQAGAYRDARVAEAERQAELSGAAAELDRLIARLGEPWTEGTISTFQLTVADEDGVRLRRERHRELVRVTELRRAELDVLRPQEAAARELAEERKRRLERERAELKRRFPWPERSPEELRLELQRLREEDAERKRLRHELGLLKGETPSAGFPPVPSRSASAGSSVGGGWLGWTLAALSAALPAAIWWSGQPALAAVCFAALLAVAVAAIRTHRPARTEGRVRNAASARIRELEQSLIRTERTLRRRIASFIGETAEREPFAREAAAALEPIDNATDDAVERLQREADMWLEARRQVAQAEAAWTEACEAASTLTRQLRQAEDRLDEAERALADWRSDWEAWLAERGLPPSLSPDGMLELMQVADRGRALAQRKEQLHAELKAAREFAAAFEAQAAALCGMAGQDRTGGWDPTLALKQRKAEADRQQLLLASREHIRREAETLRRELLTVDSRLERVTGAISALWGEAGADDEETFRLRARLHEERKALVARRRELVATLRAMFGEERLTEALETIRSGQPGVLEEELRRQREALAELEQRLDALRDRRGRLRNEMEKLENGQDYVDLRQRVEERAAEVRQLARRWAELAIASALFERAKERYERERQPAVLQAASRNFSRMTGGEYVRVFAPVGEKRLVAVNRDLKPLDSSLLSRGTAEQLYLAMRLAIAEQYGKYAALPLILDDVLVNFDAERLARCAVLLREASSSHQILLFTCHPHVRAAMREAVPDLQIVDM